LIDVLSNQEDIHMSRNKSHKQTNSSYPPLHLWVSFLWSLISLNSLFLLFAGRASAQVPQTVVPEFQVNTNITGNQESPAVVSLTSGDWVVTWTGAQTGNSDIYAQRYAVNGGALGQEFRVNTNTTGEQSNSALVSLATGDWVLAWQSSSSQADASGSYNYDIYAQRYAGNGTTLGTEFRVNTNTTREQPNLVLVSLTSGDWVVAWTGTQTGNADIYAQRYAVNGSVLGQEFRVNTNTTGEQSNPALVSLATGDWVLAWQSSSSQADASGSYNYDIYAQRYAGNGSTLGTEFRVNTNTTREQSNPVLVSLTSGDWVVAWTGTQTGNTDIYARLYAVNGSALGQEFRVSTNIMGEPNPALVSLATGEWVVVWQSSSTQADASGLYNYDIYAQRYAGNGSALGPEFRVNINATSDQASPTLANLVSGNWVVAWKGSQAVSYEIYATIFSLMSSATTISSRLTTTISKSTTQATTIAQTTFRTTTNTPSPATQTTNKVTSEISSSSLATQTPINFVTELSGMVTAATEALSESSAQSNALNTTQVDMKVTSTNDTQVIMPSAVDNAGNKGSIIAATVGGGMVLASCLAAIGFYAHRKKAEANKTNNVISNEQDTALKDIENYQQIPIASPNQQAQNEYGIYVIADDKHVEESKYAKIDEIKKDEKQYDNAPKLEL
jgi:hypothetical protein